MKLVPNLLSATGLVLGLALCIGTAGAATLAEQNKETALAFYRLAFNDHKPREAADQYIGPVYIQHNPYVPNGVRPFYGYFEKFFKENPDATSTLKHVFADGDHVVLHTHSKLNAQDRGKAIVDIFRLEQGKIVEHWDVLQDVPATSANGNTMFEGSRAD